MCLAIKKLWLNYKSQTQKGIVFFVAFFVFCIGALSYAQERDITVVVLDDDYLVLLGPAIFEPPSSFNIVGLSDNEVTLAFSPVSGADAYQVELLNPETGEWEIVNVGPDTQITIPGLGFGLNDFRVRSCFKENCGRASALFQVNNRPSVNDSTPNYLGSLQGAYDTQTDGSFSYQIPIEVPPGINGVQASLSLNYNSNQRNGLVGWGWSLGGLSMISRCPADHVRDGFVAGINPADLPRYSDGKYRYCLDGERLINISDNEYRTEREKFLLIKKTSQGWTVTDQQGSQTNYGHSGDSKRNDSSNVPYVWYSNEVKDVSNNTMRIAYEANASGVNRPSRIDYTKNSAGDTNHSIEFVYEDRDDEIVAYRAGSKELTDKRLSRIVVKTQGAQVRSYNLAYQQLGQIYNGQSFDDPTQSSRLSQISRCFENQSRCSEPVVFNWTSATKADYTIADSTPYEVVNNFPDNYRCDNCTFNTDQSPSVWAPGYTNRKPFSSYEGRNGSLRQHRAAYGDFDGDDVKEFVNGACDDSICVWSIVRPDGSLDVPFSQDMVTDAQSTIREEITESTNRVRISLANYYPYVTDFNGDGLDDIYVAANGLGSALFVFISDGTRMVFSSEYSKKGDTLNPLGQGCNASNCVTTHWRYHNLVMDINGDGLVDLVQVPPVTDYEQPITIANTGLTQVRVALNTGNGFAGFTDWGDMNAYQTLRKAPWASGQYVPRFADVNGDGLPDMVGYLSGYPIEVGINTGIGFTYRSDWGWSDVAPGEKLPINPSTVFQEDHQELSNLHRFADFNGDGYDDLYYRINNVIYVALSTGSRFTNPSVWFADASNDGLGRGRSRFIVADINYDGKMDLTVSGQDVTRTRTAMQGGQTIEGLSTDETIYYSQGNKFVAKVPVIPAVRGTFYQWRYSLTVTEEGEGVAHGLRQCGVSDLGAQAESGDVTTVGARPRVCPPFSNAPALAFRIAPYGARLERINEPDRQTIDITYGRFNKNPDLYTQETGGNIGGGVHRNVHSYAVNTVRADTESRGAQRGMGVAQIQVTDVVGTVQTSNYHYYNAKYHRGGYGNLGFAKIRQDTLVNNIPLKRQETEYLQETSPNYNLAGSVSKEKNWVVKDNGQLGLTSTTDYQWQVRVYSNDTTPDFNHPHYFPYEITSHTTKYDLETSKQVGQEITKIAYDNSDQTGCNVPNFPRQITTDKYFYQEGIAKNIVQSRCDAFGVMGSRTQNFEVQTFHAYGLVGNKKSTYWSPKASGVVDTRTQEVSYVYNKKGQTTTEVLEPKGNSDVKITREYRYNAYGTITSTTERWGNTTHNGLNFSSRRSTVVEAYQNSARQLITINALGQRSRQRFDARFGLETFLNDINNQTYVATYDAQGRLSQYIEPNDIRTNVSYKVCDGCFAYSAHERWYQQRIRDGESETRTYYDGLDREVGTRTRGLTNEFTYTGQSYDALGRVNRILEPLRSGTGHATIIHYDNLDRPRTTRYANGGEQRVTYDVADQARKTYYQARISSTDSLGRVTQKLVDTNEQTKRIIDPLDTHINYTYDPLGNLTQVELEGNKQIITYDQRSRKTRLVDPDIGTITYQYNPLGELAQETNNKGEVTRYQYDPLARQIRRTEDATSEAPQQQNYSYDATNGIGLISAITGIDTQGRAHAKRFSYNNLGLLTQLRSTIAGQDYSTDYTYDLVNRVNTLTYPTGFAIQNSYSRTGVLNRISRVDAAAVYWRARADDARGNITSATLGNGLVDNKAYDPRTGLLNTASATGRGYVAQDQRYEWDSEGNLTLRQDNRATPVTQRFCYDSLDRLKIVTSGTCNNTNNNSGVDFAYSKVGNLLNKQGTSYTYGAGTAGPHAVTSAAGQTYRYDANGNMVSGNGRQISYTAFGKPITMTQDTNRVSMTYGSDQSRIQREEKNTTGNSLTTYVSHDLITAYEKVERDTQTQHLHYINAPNGTDNTVTTVALYTQTEEVDTTNEQTIYHHRDHLGSIVAKTDDQGDLQSTLLAYDVWGKRLETNWNGNEVSESQTQGNQRGYTDHEHLDSIGLIHMNGRVYDPKLARFISPDPYIQDPYNTQSFNRYSYVWNNPLRHTDPTGEFIPLIIAGIKIAGLAYGVYEAAEVARGIATGEITGQEAVTGAVITAGIGVVGGAIVKLANKVTPPVVEEQIKDVVDKALRKNTDAQQNLSDSGTPLKKEQGGGDNNTVVASDVSSDATKGTGALRLPQSLSAAVNITTRSRIKDNPFAVRLAQSLSQGAQRDVDNLLSALRAGNANPGIGTRALGNSFFELRGRNAGRVIIKQTSSGSFDIIGKFQGHARGDAANSAIIQKLIKIGGG